MKVWVVGCILLFLIAEFFQWAKGFILPLPLYVLAGAFLSIASNYKPSQESTSLQSSQTATLLDPFEGQILSSIETKLLDSENP